MATIQKRGNAYSIRVSCGYDINGSQIIKSFSWIPDQNMTPRQIEKELKRQTILFEEKVKTGQSLNGSIKFIDFCDLWLTDYGLSNLAPTTLKRYKGILERVNAAIGHIRIDKIQPHHLVEFYNNLSENNISKKTSYKANQSLIDFVNSLASKESLDISKLSKKTINCCLNGISISPYSANAICRSLGIKKDDFFILQKKRNGSLSASTILYHHRVISSILSTAVEWQAIFSNPAERVKPPKVEYKESRYLDENQAKRLIELLAQEPVQFRTAITLLLYSGIRRGELCGLTWSDIDFENNVLSIHRSSQYLPGKGVFDKETKTRSSLRSIKLADVSIGLLREFRAYQNEQRLMMGDKWNHCNKIFTQWDGSPIHPDTLTSWFKKFIKRNNFPDVTIHSLRHTNATLLIVGGTDIRTVSKRLGHAQTSTTSNIYAHSIKSADEAAAHTLENLLNPIYKKSI